MELIIEGSAVKIYMITKQEIIAFFKKRSARPLSLRDLSEQMGLSRPEARALKRLLRDMVRSGELLLTRKGL
jgi:exoribonuclease R